ncbi:MAG TPA: DUF2723 domain-containing protein [Kofleriaceae bacterium]|nr:DUF2723 domain-containing protein [Kofleriaceae bacterium]
MLRSLQGRAARIAFDHGGLLVLAVGILYVWLAPAHVVDVDNAEFSTLGALGGAAHPTGYPTYVLCLRALSWLPATTPAHTAAIATALIGTASIAMLHAACRAWGARPLAATVACAFVAGSPLVMTMYTEAEVFALNGLVVATILWLAAAHGPLRGIARAAALGLVAGLGLGGHVTCVLVAPVGVLGVVRGAREARRPPAVTDPRASAAPARAAIAALAAIGGCALGLCTYAYLVVAPVHAASWGSFHGISDVVDAFLRRDYGGPGAFATRGQDVAASTNLGALAASIGRAWLWLPALAGIAAAIERIARPRGRDGEPRWGWIAWFASFVLAGPLLVLRFDIPPEGIGAFVVHRFHILPAVLLAIPVADAFGRVWPGVPSRLMHGAALAVFAALAGTSLGHVQRAHAPAVEWQVRDMLRSLPAFAVVIGYDDDLARGTQYLQVALGERTDVDYVQEPQLRLAWVRARVAARGLATTGLVDDALAKHRPVFVQSYARDVLATHPSYPYGILVRVLARGEHAPSLDEVVAMNRALYEHLELPYARPSVDDEIPAAIHERYAATWLTLAQALDARGRAADADDARAMATAIGPVP